MSVRKDRVCIRRFAAEALENRRLFAVSLGSILSNISVDPGAAPTDLDLSSAFSDPTTVLVKTTNGNIEIQMLPQSAPQTVANFLRYVNAGLYNNTVFHSAVANFIDEAGGFYADGSPIPSFGTIPNEFHTSNTLGTVAMAKVNGDPNSAASEWLINVGNNSGVLDSQNGGFTVFGQVVGNGMSVANTINSLPTIDASQFNSSLPAKPDDPLPVQNAAAGVAPSNLVVITSMAEENSLTLSASSDNPSLVTASMGSDGHTLMLTYAASQKGVAYVTVTGRDTSGDSLSQRFRVNVGTSGDLVGVSLGKAAARQVSFVQDNGAHVTVSLRGPGTATVDILGNASTPSAGKNVTVNGSGLTLFDIVAQGTTAGSALNITTRGKGVVQLGGLSSSGSLGAINAKSITLAGDLTASGSIGSISFRALDNTNKLTGSAQVTASSLNSVVVTGTINNTALDIAGSIRSISAGAMTNSLVFAGVASLGGGQTLPNAAADFTSATIKTVKIKGVFSNSDIAALTLGTVGLGSIHVANGGTPFGIASHAISALTGLNVSNHKRIVVHHLSVAATAASLQSTLGLADMKLVIV